MKQKIKEIFFIIIISFILINLISVFYTVSANSVAKINGTQTVIIDGEDVLVNYAVNVDNTDTFTIKIVDTSTGKSIEKTLKLEDLTEQDISNQEGNSGVFAYITEEDQEFYVKKAIDKVCIENYQELIESEIVEENPEEPIVEEEPEIESISQIIKKAVAKWYYIIRLIVVAFMLVLLIFIGVKMALSTAASEKAVYKQMLVDWLVGMIIVFTIHYIMVGILLINDTIVDSLRPLAKEQTVIKEEYEYGLDENKENEKTSAEIETTLYEEARTRAYSLKMTDGFTGLVIYGILVYYAWRFALMYFRRVINIMILTLLSPAVAASYALNKVISGKSQIFTTWLTEYVMNVIIQIVHVVLYVAFVSTALRLSLESISGVILAFILFNFMSKGDKILRQLFRLSGGSGSLSGDMNDRTSFRQMRKEIMSIKNAMVGGPITKRAIKTTYGAVEKPLGAVATGIATKATVAYMNSDRYKRKKEEKEKSSEEQREKDINEFLMKNEKYQKLVKAEERKEAIIKDLQKYKNSNSSRELDMKKILDNNLNETNARIKELTNDVINNEIKKEFIKYQLSKDVPIMETFKTNLGFAFSELVEKKNIQRKDKNGNIVTEQRYVAREVSTRKEGGNDKAFWRKTKSSKVIKFKNNMKLKSLFGISDAENKLLKNQINTINKQITGLASLILSAPAMGVNPLLGMALLTNGVNVTTDVRRRKNIYRARKSFGTFKFKSFGTGPIKRFNEYASSNFVLEMDQMEVLQHKKIRKEVFQANQYIKVMEKIEEKQEKDNNIKFKELSNEYDNKVEKIQDSIEKKIFNKNTEDIAYEQIVRQNDTVDVGNEICMQLKENSQLNIFFDEIEKLDENMSKEERIKAIENLMDKYKNPIITESILEVCKQNGIQEIDQLQLTDEDMVQINSNIKDMLELRGLVETGKIENNIISENDISNVYLNLNMNSEDINNQILSNNVKSAILEYMEKNQIQDTAELRTQKSKEEITKLVKQNCLTEASKQSNDVIKKISGKTQIQDDINLPDKFESILEENINYVKKVKKRRFSS